MVEVHPLVKELDKKRKEKNMSIRETARLIGMTYYPVYSWLKKERSPSRTSLKKVQKAIEKIDNGEWREPPKVEIKFRYKKLREDLPIALHIMYGRIQAIENEFGSLTNCPEDHWRLIALREQVK